jgi:hypothetical protein
VWEIVILSDRNKENWIKLNCYVLEPYADDVNLLGDNTDTIKKNTQTLIDASREGGLEVNTEKTKYEGWNFNSGNTAVETPCKGTK